MPRTAKGAGTGKRYPLNMRTTKSTREMLERAAAESGRSLAQEVEYRLERSFDLEAEVEMLRLRLDEQELATTVLESAKDVLRRVEAAGFSAGAATVSGVGEDAAASRERDRLEGEQRALQGLLSPEKGDDNG